VDTEHRAECIVGRGAPAIAAASLQECCEIVAEMTEKRPARPPDQSRGAAATPRPVDTIVAVATPPGYGGIGIVRISGPGAGVLASAVLGEVPPAGRAVARAFRDATGAAIDAGIAIFYAAPRSFTGEDVLELQGHGGPVVLDLVVARCLELGARGARPGEFSERAFLNDKLDLAQAEAVADLIAAGSATAARAAFRSLSGEFSVRVEALATSITELRTHVEAAIDFADEDLELLVGGALAASLARLLDAFDRLDAAAEQGRLLHDGYTVVIAGRPNAGKSSLLNVLAGHEAAIVTAIPGTTRDVLRERIDIDGLPITVLDTAGLRESPDVVEAEGIRRAQHEIGRADRVLFIVDAADPAALEVLSADVARLPGDVPVTLVFNKSDLRAPTLATPAGVERALAISARTGAGLAELRAHIKSAAGYRPAEASTFSARRRHLDALRRARGHAERARDTLTRNAGAEFVAEELRLGHDALGEITGRFTSEDLLGEIFASFCIGK
jgi:tRNA modification GTPase